VTKFYFLVGYGATSVVYKASWNQNEKKKDGQTVAIKKIKNLFENEVYAHRVLREMRLLRLLKGHNNIVEMKTIMRPTNPKAFNDLNIVTEYCT
jgi:serine/threonine protein kinase